MNALTIAAIFGITLVLAFIFMFLCTVLIGAPYVPSNGKEIENALTKLYKISEKDLLVDLGSGDGVVLKHASQHGAKAFGIEINSFLIWISRWRLRKFPGAKVVLGNIYSTKFPNETTVVYVFGDSRDIKAIVRHINRESKRIGHPLHIISNAFEIPGLKPVKNYRAHFLYKVDGSEIKFKK
jgi:SAM-dependent methyltransferase